MHKNEVESNVRTMKNVGANKIDKVIGNKWKEISSIKIRKITINTA